MWEREAAGCKYFRGALPSWIRDDLNKCPMAKRRHNLSFGRFRPPPPPPTPFGKPCGGHLRRIEVPSRAPFADPFGIKKRSRIQVLSCFLMRTPAAQPKSSGSRYRWASRSDNVPAPQSRHNRPPKSNALPSAANKAARVRVLAGFTPPSRSRAAQMAWLVKFLRHPSICAWSFRPAQNICRLPPLVEVGRGGGAQRRQKLERWHVFSKGDMYFKHLQPKMRLPSLCTLCADGISSIP